MVTILDFNPTKEDWDLFIGDFSKEEVLAMDEDSQRRMIGELLWERGEKDKAQKYINAIEDEQLRLDVIRSITHPLPELSITPPPDC